MQQEHNGILYEISDEFSFKDFTGQNFQQKNLDNLVIYGSCFSHETPEAESFKPDLTGAIFIKCNLSNVKIPNGNTVIDCNTTRFKIQNDLRDWEIDGTGKPVKVMGEKYWILQGFSVDPKDIPETKASSIKDVKKAGV